MINKKKTKELNYIYKPRWSGKQEYYKNLEQFHCKNGKTLNGEDIYVMTKSDVNNLLTQQRTELLEEYFDKEDDLIIKHANLKDDNWDKFLEARSKLKINLLNKKNV